LLNLAVLGTQDYPLDRGGDIDSSSVSDLLAIRAPSQRTCSTTTQQQKNDRGRRIGGICGDTIANVAMTRHFPSDARLSRRTGTDPSLRELSMYSEYIVAITIMLSSRKKRRRVPGTTASSKFRVESEPPNRVCHNLYASHITYGCAIQRGCVPCAYKICCFDVALDHEFCRAVPNQRPEMCPRTSDIAGLPGTIGYIGGMKVLTVGDGDFTFSLAIARMVSGSGLVATSYESRETLCSVYPGVEKTIAELMSLDADIRFNVDATRIRATLPSIKERSFHRIVWNFPCEAGSQGRDGQNKEMELNKNLVHEFVANARHLLLEQGQVHITHKTKVRPFLLLV
jgi:hypothetical protein